MNAKFVAIPMSTEGALKGEEKAHIFTDEDELRDYIFDDIEYFLDKLRESIIVTEKTLESLKQDYIKLRESKEKLEYVDDGRLVDCCNEIYEARKYPRRIMLTDYQEDTYDTGEKKYG